MNLQTTPRIDLRGHVSANEIDESPVPAETNRDDYFVASAHHQPPSFQQSAQAIASQRAAWAHVPVPGSSNYLVIGGQRVSVPFPTVCFDQRKNIAIDAALPTSTWAKNLLRTVWAGAETLTSPTALSAANFKQLLEPARLRSLWTQGNLQVCAVPRQNTTGAGVNAIVLHWDGCNSSAQMFEVLRSLGLSAHLLVDSDATVYQLMDLAKMKAYHAGWVNERSIGIEFNNPVDPSRVAPGQTSRALVQGLIPHHDGVISTHLDFTPAQKQRCLEILDVLHDNFNVPRSLPPGIDKDGVEASPKLVAREYTGVCGHYHIATHKIDPGLSLWPSIRHHWAQLQSALPALSEDVQDERKRTASTSLVA